MSIAGDSAQAHRRPAGHLAERRCSATSPASMPVDPLFPGGIGPSLRGMRAERYVDGLPNYYDLGVRDLLANVERIEVLKGPASILFQGGASPVGGVVNIVSQACRRAERFAEAGVRAGGYRFVSPYIDVNQPLTDDKSVLFRVTAQYEIDAFQHRRRASPQLFDQSDAEIRADARTPRSIIQGHVSRRDQPDYPGLPATGTIDRSFYSLRPTSFLANSPLPATRRPNRRASRCASIIASTRPSRPSRARAGRRRECTSRRKFPSRQSADLISSIRSLGDRMAARANSSC